MVDGAYSSTDVQPPHRSLVSKVAALPQGTQVDVEFMNVRLKETIDDSKKASLERLHYGLNILAMIHKQAFPRDRGKPLCSQIHVHLVHIGHCFGAL